MADEQITANGLSLAIAAIEAARRTGRADEGRAMWSGLTSEQLQESLTAMVVCFDYLAELAPGGAAEETLADMRTFAAVTAALQSSVQPHRPVFLRSPRMSSTMSTPGVGDDLGSA